MAGDILISLFLKVTIFFIMLGIGMSLAIENFKQVLIKPTAFVIGFTAQLILLPLISWLIVNLFDLDPVLAVGLMIVSFCPGGVASNLFSFLARGDVALSVALTTVVSIVTPFTIPLLTVISMNHLLNYGYGFELSIIHTMATLVLLTLLPVVIGMALNYKFPDFCANVKVVVRVSSFFGLIIILFCLLGSNMSDVSYYIEQLALPTLALNVVAMLLGFFIAVALRLERPQAITISYELGIQNGTMALLITYSFLDSYVMSMSPLIYSVIMMITGSVLGFMFSCLSSD